MRARYEVGVEGNYRYMQPPGTPTSRLSRVGHFRYLPNYLVVISRLVLSVMAGTEASE